MPTGIAYADETWNPVSGCLPELPCWERCWARRQAHRRPDLYGRGPNGEEFWPTFHPERLDQPLHWREPRVVLVSAMGDLFNGQVTVEFIEQVFRAMGQRYYASRDRVVTHTFLVLTKRAERMRDVITALCGSGITWREGCTGYLPPNVWLGVSVTSQADADERLPILCATPAAHRWVSYEPALGPVRLNPWTLNLDAPHRVGQIEWVVAGCESGPGARPAPHEWLRDVQEQCREAGVPCYVKQTSGEAGEPKVIHFEPRPGELPWALRRKHDG